MTTYTTISNAAVAVGGIPASSTVQALRDNPLAIAEGASGAPMVMVGWHPYNKLNAADGNTGKFYDQATNGNQDSVVTPDLEDGYEYRIIGYDLGRQELDATQITFEYYQETTAAYITGPTITGIPTGSSVSLSFDLTMHIPRVTHRTHLGSINGLFVTNPNVAITLASAQKVLRVRVGVNNLDKFSAGKMFLLRRREFMSID